MVMPEFHALVDEAKREVQEIGPRDLSSLQQQGKDLVVIDVREREDHAKGAIPRR